MVGQIDPRGGIVLLLFTPAQQRREIRIDRCQRRVRSAVLSYLLNDAEPNTSTSPSWKLGGATRHCLRV
jgi:hypothetical protein